MATTTRPTSRRTAAAYGSDVVVDMLQALEIEYVALNPGASYRGIHDSLVNYGKGNPELVLCTHEEIAVSVAHGYARATGKPMAAAVHNVVGLLHAATPIYNAWLDYVPTLVLGGTGPVASDLRRPYIDWVHTALVQGNAIRDYVKWDDQPASPAATADSMLRAYQLMMTAPQGPAYLCFDADLQESPLDKPFEVPDISRFAPAEAPQASAETLRRIVELLRNAERPVVLADYMPREAVDPLRRLAEALALPVVDLGDLFNFPTRHPLNLTQASSELLAEADVVLALNVFDLEQALSVTDRSTRLPRVVLPEGAKLVDVSLRQYSVRAWGQTYGKLMPADASVLADVGQVVPALLELAQAEPGGADHADAVRQRHTRLTALYNEHADRDADRAARVQDDSAITLPFIAQQTWEVVRGHEWVLAERDLRGSWAHRLWDIAQPHQYQATGRAGIGNGMGRAVGVGLGHRGSDRLLVHFQPDGDLLYTPGALWTLANLEIPMLIVMHNNRAYNNDEVHQVEVARHRERPVENAGIGIRVEEPSVDFATVAKGFGVHGEGPVERPADLPAALERAMRVVIEQRRPALVDVVTVERAN